MEIGKLIQYRTIEKKHRLIKTVSILLWLVGSVA